MAEGSLLSCIEKPLKSESYFKKQFGMSFSDKSFCHESNVKTKSASSILTAHRRCYIVECSSSSSSNLVFSDGSKATCSTSGTNITFWLPVLTLDGLSVEIQQSFAVNNSIQDAVEVASNSGFCAIESNCYELKANGKCSAECDVYLGSICVSAGNNADIVN